MTRNILINYFLFLQCNVLFIIMYSWVGRYIRQTINAFLNKIKNSFYLSFPSVCHILKHWLRACFSIHDKYGISDWVENASKNVLS